MRPLFISILTIVSLFLVFGCTPKQQFIQPQSEKPVALAEAKSDWQTQWDATAAAARKEGKVTLYGAYGLAEARDVFINTMKKKYGLDLEVTIARGDLLATKLKTERNAGLYVADVYMGGFSDFVTYLFPAKILDPIEPGLIFPDIKDPNTWLGGKLPIPDKQRIVFASMAQISTRTAINTTLVKPEEMQAYQDIINPKWKGKIAMTDPTISGSGGSWVFLAGLLMGQDYLKEVVKQEPMITRDSRLLAEWLARGKYAIALGTDTGATKSFIQLGSPILFVPRFKEGTDLRGSAGYTSFVNTPAHPNAAKVFVNWILSKDGQTILSKALGVASRRVDVPTDHLEAWQIPDPTIKYLSREYEEAQLEEAKTQELNKDLFAPLLK